MLFNAPSQHLLCILPQRVYSGFYPVDPSFSKEPPHSFAPVLVGSTQLTFSCMVLLLTPAHHNGPQFPTMECPSSLNLYSRWLYSYHVRNLPWLPAGSTIHVTHNHILFLIFYNIMYIVFIMPTKLWAFQEPE